MARKDFSGREYYKYAGMGFEFTGVVALFFYFGHLADARWGWEPWGLVTGGAIGLIGSTYLLAKKGFVMMREFDEASQNNRSNRSENTD